MKKQKESLLICADKKERKKKKRAKKRRPFHQLNQGMRDRIEMHINEGETQESIATVLKVDPSTVSRERNKRKRKNGHYDADTAQHKAEVKRSLASYQGRKIEKNKDMKKHIIAELKKKRSPDEISGRMKEENMPFYAGKDAIYGWLYSVWGQRYCVYLCSERYRPKPQTKKTKREMIPNRVSVTERPQEGEHLEGDTFVSPTRLGTTVSGTLVVVPSAQLLFGRIIPNRKPSTMTISVNAITKPLSGENMDMTLDNGIENKEHEQWEISTYFADPHSPWQKPHVENNIGLLRRWFIPKGTDLRNVSNDELQQHLHTLNCKYRKSLGYRSAYEVALERGIIQKVPEFV